MVSVKSFGVKLWLELSQNISFSCTETLVVLRSIKELYICQTPVNMHSVHGKVSVYRTCGRETAEPLGHFISANRGFPQSEAKECAVNNLADRNMETYASSWAC